MDSPSENDFPNSELVYHAHMDHHVGGVVGTNRRRSLRKFYLLTNFSHLLFQPGKTGAFKLGRCNHSLAQGVYPGSIRIFESEMQVWSGATAR